MVPASKRARTTATPTVTPDGAYSSGVLAQPPSFIHFHTGPSLERIPDDVLHEILSYLPNLDDRHVLLGHRSISPVVSSAKLVRTPTLRALSKTSRLLRSRCLAMAWRNVELCGVNLSKHRDSFHSVIGEATKACVRVLKTCPHLLPLIRTVSVVLTLYHSDEIIPAFAACLATLPNLNVIQVIRAHSRMTTVKNGFEGKRFPSVRRITLPGSAHEIIKSCPNLEEVVCTEGNGSTIIGSLAKGNCTQVRVLKGISAPLTRLVKVLPNLTHIDVDKGGDMTPLPSFSHLHTIEILVRCRMQDKMLSEIAASDVEEASKILKGNKSPAEKTVLLTNWDNIWNRPNHIFDILSDAGMIREAIRV